MQSKPDFLLDLVRLLEFFLSLHSHILKVVHHFDLLLESGHLDLDFDGLFLELGISQGLRSDEMRLILAKFVLEAA
jgi:hypothetical protein